MENKWQTLFEKKKVDQEHARNQISLVERVAKNIGYTKSLTDEELSLVNKRSAISDTSILLHLLGEDHGECLYRRFKNFSREIMGCEIHSPELLADPAYNKILEIFRGIKHIPPIYCRSPQAGWYRDMEVPLSGLAKKFVTRTLTQKEYGSILDGTNLQIRKAVESAEKIKQSYWGREVGALEGVATVTAAFLPIILLIYGITFVSRGLRTGEFHLSPRKQWEAVRKYNNKRSKQLEKTFQDYKTQDKDK